MGLNFTQYLKTLYPFYYSSIKNVISILLLIATLSFLFSYVFEPFEVNRAEHKIDYFWICLIHAVTPLFIGIIFFSVLNKLVKEEYKWTLGKEAVWISLYLLLIGIGSFLIRDIIYDKPDNWSFRYFFEEIRNTFLIGVLIISIILPLNLERLLSKYKAKAKIIKVDYKTEIIEGSVKIETPLKSEAFELKLSDFVFAKVEGNYTDIFLKNEKTVQQKMKRISLKVLESKLVAYPYIIKTHRSFLVNTKHVVSVSGNAQGYILSLAECEEKVPVSRSNIAAFDTAISTNS